MSKKIEILDLLNEQELTTKEIAQKLDITPNEARVYVNRLKSKGKVKVIGKKERYKIYRAIESTEINLDTQILKKLIIPFAKNGIKVDLESKEIERIKQLMELIK